MYDRMTSNGNGNKANMRICMLENLLKATEAAGTSARSQYLHQKQKLFLESRQKQRVQTAKTGNQAVKRRKKNGYSGEEVNSLKQVIRRNKMDMAPDASSSLDLMREIFQNEITREIQQILDRHIRTTFSPAIENLRRNGHEVDDQVINTLFINILEAAKAPYLPEKENEPQEVKPIVEIREPPPSVERPVKREDERLQMDLSPLSQNDVTRWNPERFGLTTLFLPASKYACDDADRRLLVEDSRVSENDTSRVYLVCLDDVRDIAAKQELEQSAFCLKEALVLKIRRYAQPFFERLLHRHKQQQMQQWPYAES